MNRRTAGGLDPRAWLAWGAAATLPVLLGRNPFPLTAVACIVLAVRVACLGASHRTPVAVMRLVAILALVGVLFNLLTVHAGDRVILVIPEGIPILGGPVTLNALVYGLLAGEALVVLALAWGTVGALLDWPTLLRLAPNRLTGPAVAGSIAFAFIPQTVTAWSEIGEARAIRGLPAGGIAAVAARTAPLLGNGLDRSVTLAETLESRAFGSVPSGSGTELSPIRRYLPLAGLCLAVVSLTLLVSGRGWLGVTVGMLGVATFFASFRINSIGPTRSRYRPTAWTRRETAVTIGALVAATGSIIALELNPATFRYEPYPTITVPLASIPLLLLLCGLLAPALVAPQAADRTRPEGA